MDPNGLVLGQDQDCVGGCFDPAQAFQGRLDDVGIWNRALSFDEINDAKNGRAGTSGLVGYWQFNEASGVVAGD